MFITYKWLRIVRTNVTVTTKILRSSNSSSTSKPDPSPPIDLTVNLFPPSEFPRTRYTYTYQYHDDQGNVKTAEGRVDLVAEVLWHGAVRHALLRHRVLVAEIQQRWQTHTRCAQPDRCHVQDHAVSRTLNTVVQRLRDRVVPESKENKNLMKVFELEVKGWFLLKKWELCR